MPDLSADCPMARMIADGMIEEMRRRYDDLAIVCYINSTAELKCKSDVCISRYWCELYFKRCFNALVADSRSFP